LNIVNIVPEKDVDIVNIG